MDAVTYPDARVASFVDENFNAIRTNIREPQPAMRDLLRAIKPPWAPTFVFIGPRNVELRRYVGWLPPVEFIADLNFILGVNDLLRLRFEESYNGSGAQSRAIASGFDADIAVLSLEGDISRLVEAGRQEQAQLFGRVPSSAEREE